MQSKSLVESDFEENLLYKGTEHFNSRNSTISSSASNYERSYTFSASGGSGSSSSSSSGTQLFYLDLIELDEKHYEVKRIAFKTANPKLLRAKLLINSRLYADEWANAQLEIRIDRSLLDTAAKIRLFFENERDFKLSKSFEEFKEKVN